MQECMESNLCPPATTGTQVQPHTPSATIPSLLDQYQDDNVGTNSEQSQARRGKIG